MRLCLALVVVVTTCIPAQLDAQTNPLWSEQKVKNFLPHMTWPEVRGLLSRTDMVLITTWSSRGALPYRRRLSSAAQCLINQGFRRILLCASHTGNQSIASYVADRVNQETPAVAVNLADGVTAMRDPPVGRQSASTAPPISRKNVPPRFFASLTIPIVRGRAATRFSSTRFIRTDRRPAHLCIAAVRNKLLR